jgi:hypothetical protein
MHRVHPSVLGSLTTCLILPAAAHHSWSASYDLARSERISGVIARVLYQSPHSSLRVDVEMPNGQVERWTVEWASPSRLRERGVTEHTIRPGDEVTVHGNPHRNPAAKSLRLERLQRSDGFAYP